MTVIDPEEIEIRKLLRMSLQLTPESHAMRHCCCVKCEDARKVVALIRAAVAEQRERDAKIADDEVDCVGVAIGPREAATAKRIARRIRKTT